MLKPSVNRTKLTLAIVWRFLGAGVNSLSSVGRLAFAGLVISVLVLVVVLSVVNGFERELQDRVLRVLPGLSIDFNGGLLPADAQTLDDLPAGVSGIAPMVQANVLLVNGERMQGALATGIDQRYATVSDLPEYIPGGSFAELGQTKFGLLMGAGLARKLGVVAGDSVRLVVPAVNIGPAGVMPRQRDMQIVALYVSESLLDSQGVYLNLQTAQTLLRLAHPQGVHVKLQDLFATAEPVRHFHERFGERIRVRSWVESYGNLYHAIAVQKATMFVLLLFLIAVAAFNLVSGLVMIVEQRRSDVAVLRTLGYETFDIICLFVWLGLLLAASGIVLGLACGVALAMALPGLFAQLNSLFDAGLMSQYFIAYLPTQVSASDLTTIAAVAVVMSLAASFFPAWRAARTLPSGVLNHE